MRVPIGCFNLSNRVVNSALSLKLRVALGGEAGTANWIAPKPKGMWHRTYERKQFEIWWCKNQADLLFIGKYSHLLSQSEMDGLFGA
jgi:hypothetical protein